MPFMAGKQAFLELLKQEGVDVLFGNPGTTELPLMDGLARALGVAGQRVAKAADIGPALARGLATGGPYLLDADVDASFKR